MKIVIMGCGRVGSHLAVLLDREGHKVTVLDNNAESLRRLPPGFKGKALLGNGLDEIALRKAGLQEADAFVAATQGDNRNIMAAQIAQHIFHVPKVVCRIYDPLRQEIYRMLGLNALSPTVMFAQLLKEAIEK